MTQKYPVVRLDEHYYILDLQTRPHKDDWYWASGLPVNEHSTFANSVHYADDENDSGLIQGTKEEPTAFHGFKAYHIPYKIIATTNPSPGLPLMKLEEHISEADVLWELDQALLECSRGIIFDKNVFYPGAPFTPEQKAELKLEWLKQLGVWPIKSNKGGWTDEDMRKCWNEAQKRNGAFGWTVDIFIKSLKPIPKQVEVEMETYKNLGEEKLKPLHLRPKLKDGYVTIKNIIYEK